MSAASKTNFVRLFVGLCLGLSASVFNARSQEDWQTALAAMPLRTNIAELNASNCLPILLGAFQSNHTVKALIFLPEATDEFFWLHRARAKLTNDTPTLLDAINALTNQTYIRATFCPPLLLLRTAADPDQPLVTIHDPATAARIQQRRFVPHALYDDRDWDFLLPIMKKTSGATITPKLHSKYSFHFYRPCFAAWDLSAWEGLEAVSLASKTVFTIEKKQVDFIGDPRSRP
jgi:hypothetical protein